MFNDYFNPGATKPADLGVPGLSGFQNYYDRQMYERLMALQEQHMQDTNQTYQLDAPVREAARPEAISKSGLATLLNEARARDPRYVQAQVEGDIGDANKRGVEGRVAVATEGERTGSERGKYLGQQMEQAAEVMERTAALNPAMSQAQYTEFRRGLPEQVRTQLPETYSPEVPQLMRSFSKAVQNNLAQRRAMELEKSKEESAEKRATTMANAQMYAADKRLEAAWARMPQGTKEKVEGIIHRYFSIIMDGGEPTAQQHRAFEAAQQVMMNVRAAAQMVTVDPTGFRAAITQTPVPPRPTPPVVPAVQAGGQNVAEIQRQVEAAGEKYDPENFDYEIRNGQLGKKPKVKK